jgi:hypothetical protein
LQCVTSTIKSLLSHRPAEGAQPGGYAGGSTAANTRRNDSTLRRWAPATLAILVGAALLWVIAGVGFVNYDTLYGLVWGQQLSRGETPQYGLPIAPTPHPLVEVVGLVLAPLGAGAATAITVALAFIALSACGWMIYRLGSEWFGRAAGTVAALVLLTRVPVLSYGVRAYIDVPYLLLVLGAVLVETRRRRAGAPVLVLLGLAGLLRPEAWAFSGVYWLYLAATSTRSEPARTPKQLAQLALLAAAAPVLWVLSDLLVTGNAMWSLTNTKHTAEVLGRETGIGKVPEYIPRRIGEILRPAVLVGAALGGVLSLVWLGRRARLGAAVGVLAVAVFAAMASFGLPINSRYAFLAAAILCVFAGAAVCGWMELPHDDPHRRWWMAAAAVSVVALLASIPSQYRSNHHQLNALARQQRIQNELTALVDAGAITTGCEPIGVTNHAPVPLLALWLETPPSRIANLQVTKIAYGTFVDPADAEVQKEYILDPNDPHQPVAAPAGFMVSHTDRSWRILRRCAIRGGG